VLHAGGWRVEPTWCDYDGTGARDWHHAVEPGGVEHWCTTSQLQVLLKRHGLTFADLAYAERGDVIVASACDRFTATAAAPA
jgi:hypothetical protein